MLVGVIVTAWVVVEDTQWCVALCCSRQRWGRRWRSGEAVVALADDLTPEIAMTRAGYLR